MTKREIFDEREIMEATDGSYSREEYSDAAWRGAIKFLHSQGFTREAIVETLLSKWMRWGHDHIWGCNRKKLTGKNYDIKDTPWEQLKPLVIIPRETNMPEYKHETIPLLKDVLQAIPENRMLVIEIKTGPEILPYLKIVLDQHWNSGRISFIAFDFETIKQAKALYPEVPCYYLSMFKSDVNKQFDAAVESGLDGLDLRHAIIDQKLMDKCEEAGLDVWCWTVNDPKDARKMRSMGVTAVTTDRPAWLKKQMIVEN